MFRTLGGAGGRLYSQPLAYASLNSPSRAGSAQAQLSSSSSSSPLVTPRSSSPPRSMSLSGESSSSSTSSSSSSARSESASSSTSFFFSSSNGIGCLVLSTGSGVHSLPHSMQVTGSSLPRS